MSQTALCGTVEWDSKPTQETVFNYSTPQLEKNHVVPTAWQDEALARDGVSREVQEGRRGSEEAVPGPSVFPSGEPGVSGDHEGPTGSCSVSVP